LLGVSVSGLAINVSTTAFAQEYRAHVVHDAATGYLRPGKLIVQPSPSAPPLTKTMPFFSSGVLNAARAALQQGPDRNEEALGQRSGSGDGTSSGGQAQRTIGCSQRNPNGNVRVNQDCTYRPQSEEKIVYNPANPNNLLAGQNDGRVGFNQCGIDRSLDDGQDWGDLLPPFRAKVNNPAGEAATPADPNTHTIIGGPGTFHNHAVKAAVNLLISGTVSRDFTMVMTASVLSFGHLTNSAQPRNLSATSS